MSRELSATAVVDAMPCWDEACAVAVWVEGALCVTTCVCADPPTWAGVDGAAVWVCPARCTTVFEFVALAVAFELLDGMGTLGIQIWINVPSAPDPFGSTADGLITTEMLPGAVCVDVEVAFAVCEVGADWVMICVCPPEPPDAIWAWFDPWLTAFVFAAPAFAAELFVCETGPLLPGLLFRTTMFTFVGATWVDVAFAPAFWLVGALWEVCCDWPVPPLAPPTCVWPAVCDTTFELPLLAFALDEFVCVTGPSSPGLSIRTTMFTLVGPTWVDVALAAEVWVVGALWETV
jgi:hypothetical protein